MPKQARLTMLVVLIATAGSCGWGVSSALAEAYETPDTYPTLPWYIGACVATNGSSCYSPTVAIVEGGGCASSGTSVAVGDRGDGCGWMNREATGNAAIGLFGADAGGGLAVSDTGDATAGTFDGTAVSGTGCARAPRVAISVTGCVEAGFPGSSLGLGENELPALAVSGAGSASNHRPNGVTVAPLGDAHGGAIAVGGRDATAYGGFAAVAVTGNAYGGSVANASLLGGGNR